MKLINRFLFGILLLASTAPSFACDTSSARSVLNNMRALTSMINPEKGKYYIDSEFWAGMDSSKRLQLMTAVADAHACLEGKARHFQFIDSLTGAEIAEASPTRGIRLLQ